MSLPSEARAEPRRTVVPRGERPDTGRRVLRTLVVPHAALVTVKVGEACLDPDGLLWRVERRQDRPERGDMVLQVAELRPAELPPGHAAVRLPGPIQVVMA